MDWTAFLPGVGFAVSVAVIGWLGGRDPRNVNPVYGKRREWGLGQRRF